MCGGFKCLFVTCRYVSPQADLANTLLPDLLDAVMEGYHATFMAYGQTGSGEWKSHNIDLHCWLAIHPAVFLL